MDHLTLVRVNTHTNELIYNYAAGTSEGSPWVSVLSISAVMSTFGVVLSYFSGYIHSRNHYLYFTVTLMGSPLDRWDTVLGNPMPNTFNVIRSCLS